MKKMEFAVAVSATKEQVWETLWQDKTFRLWASIIDPGTYMVGELKIGNEVQFISSENGYGVTSLVEKLIVNEFLLLRHIADTQDDGSRGRDKEWTGGEEVYLLSEKDGITTLTARFDVPLEMEDYFKVNYPRAMEQVKALAEKNRNAKV